MIALALRVIVATCRGGAGPADKTASPNPLIVASAIARSSPSLHTMLEVTAYSGGLQLDLTRVLPVPAEAVFAAFSEADELAKWWGPRGFTIPSVDFRPRVARPYRIEMQPREGEPFYLVGEFRDVDPPVRLAYTFLWEPPDPDDTETLVALSFRKVADSTEVAFSQGPFRTEERRTLHRDGWSETFDKLEEHLLSPG